MIVMGERQMKKTVNLDAMIVREDFHVDSGYVVSNRFKQLKANDLRVDSAMRFMLRKPDFQRETRDWNVTQITNFIDSIVRTTFYSINNSMAKFCWSNICYRWCTQIECVYGMD